MNLDRLLYYENIRTDKIVRSAVELAEKARAGKIPESGDVSVYYEVQRRILGAVTTADTEGTYWENYIYRLAAESENHFSLSAEKGETDEITEMLVQGDLTVIRSLLNLDWNIVREFYDPERPCVCLLTPPIEEDGRACHLREALKFADSLSESVKKLENYYRIHLCGILGKYRAFLWNGSLQGIKEHDPITFDELIGYDIQQQQLIRNTGIFVEGKRANNVLLYGDKGTGKSSTIHAVLNQYAEQGLRAVEIPKDRIKEIDAVKEVLVGLPFKFFLFIDDLSLEERDDKVTSLKASLEGSLSEKGSNVMIVATSNRRHILKENFSDRENSVHARDTMEEQLSLSDRFGLTVCFSSTGKAEYLSIVRQLAADRKLEIGEEELFALAERWALVKGGRSPRRAKQFIDYVYACTAKQIPIEF